MTILRATALTAVALAMAACSSKSAMMDDGAQKGPVESPQVSVEPSEREINTGRTGAAPTYGTGTGTAYSGTTGGPIDSPQISVEPSEREVNVGGHTANSAPYQAASAEPFRNNAGGPVDSPMISQQPSEREVAVGFDSAGSDDAGDAVMVGGAPMYSNRNVVQNASQANNLTTLVAAVQAAELVETLEGPGPFTIFAPVNSAFDALPAGTVDSLLQPQNKGQLQNVLTYHVVPGVYDTDAILAQKGDYLSTSLSTVSGGSLTINPTGDDIYVIDSKGNAGRVIQSNVYQSNGVVHVIDTVMLP